MNIDLGFSPHHYGPYSSYVASHLDSLVNCGLLKEVTESFATVSDEQNVFGERRRHTYSIPDNIEPVWQDIQQDIQGKPQFYEWQNAINRINEQPISKHFNKLSIAAKVSLHCQLGRERASHTHTGSADCQRLRMGREYRGYQKRPLLSKGDNNR